VSDFKIVKPIVIKP